MFLVPFGADLLAAGGDGGNASVVPENVWVENQVVVIVGGGGSVRF